MLFINPKWTFLGLLGPNLISVNAIGPTPILPVCRFLHIDGSITGYTGPGIGRIRPGILRSVTNKVLTGNVATLACATHQFTAGQNVTVIGVDSTFDGTYSVTAVSAGVSFSYAKTATNVTSTAVSAGFVAGPDTTSGAGVGFCATQPMEGVTTSSTSINCAGWPVTRVTNTNPRGFSVDIYNPPTSVKRMVGQSENGSTGASVAGTVSQITGVYTNTSGPIQIFDFSSYDDIIPASTQSAQFTAGTEFAVWGRES
jgi:hypothetical protein